MDLPSHGANPSALFSALNVSKTTALYDFSVNTNPFGSPKGLTEHMMNYIQNRGFEQYPSIGGLSLKERISEIEGLPTDRLLVANGAAQIIYLIAQLVQGKPVAIVQPTFSEYEEACLANGCVVEMVPLAPSWSLELDKCIAALKKSDVLFLCSPNNPTGVSYSEETILHLMEEGKKTKTLIVIDEAFFDFTVSGHSFIGESLRFPNVLILRSLTKMYGIPGLRLGFVVGSRNLIAQLSALLPPWSVSGIAEEAGLFCLAQAEYANETANYIAKERDFMQKKLSGLGFSCVPSDVNFFLVTYQGRRRFMDDLLRELAKKRIALRHTYNFRGLDGRYLRIAVKTREENLVLLNEMAEWRHNRCSSL